MSTDDDGTGVGAALDDGADKGGNGETPLGIHRVERASLEEVVDLHAFFAPRSTNADLPCPRKRIHALRVPAGRPEKCPETLEHSG
ncbi:hypothetical protein C7I55_18135 [Sphingomonas deserti]|uniref:Uncharacterized protein n=1 Tax=Allosphingosinicella deserti TaxID=2116704 RepID=A0A2P7QKB0_9SPHN|nr:hypothetical protein C7I55_18135 [Sphingomonas deserti]